MREHRFALATAIATFVLLIVGSLVHGTGSSLACPDWPLCYGTLFPKMENGVQFEHTHRIVATTVGLMTVVLAVLLFLRSDRKLRRLGVAAALLVVFQGVLGGITVLLKLPRPISIAHLATSMCFFSLTIVIAMRTRHVRPSVSRELVPMRRWVGAAWFVVLGQIILGGLVRHTASGLACLEVPLCHGVAWPDASPERLQMVHRFGAMATCVFVLGVAAAVHRRARLAHATSGMRVLSLMPGALVLLQIGVGVASVLSLLDLSTITTHLAVGAALLGSLVALREALPYAAPGELAPATNHTEGTWVAQP